MDISSLLNGAHSSERTAAASPKNPTVQKSRKRISADESTYGSESSGYIPIVRHSSGRMPSTLVVHVPSILTLYKVLLVLGESTQRHGSPMPSKPSPRQGHVKATLVVQPSVPSLHIPITTLTGASGPFPWRPILEFVLTSTLLNILTQQQLSLLRLRLREAFSLYLASVSDKNPFAIIT
ncbi:hypothetical protein PVK06_043372 [Gossypium arboreum]|uniref:Uncharacterized protein n=1 Tax=Gossypium arboreum TaxID=29729 RepID=A0ABR0MNQ8_GOSAR|nr:hypothetical protein PVK06_043372 [Gossypium arboreum]